MRAGGTWRGSPLGRPAKEPGELPPLRKLVLPGLFIALLFGALIVRRPEPPPPPPDLTELNGQVFGTTFTIKVVGEADGAALAVAVDETLSAIDASMSTWKPDSELSRLNAAGTEPFAVSPELVEVLELSGGVWASSMGAFDPTVGPLVDLWGFGSKGRELPEPTEEQLAEVVLGFDGVGIAPDAVTKRDAAIRIDLSAVAKGWAVDQLAEELQAAGHADYLVEIGGEVRVGGTKAGQPWILGVENPAGGVWTQVQLLDAALATSGDYRNVVRGKSHTIDPRTRRPVTHQLASVSVVADTCGLADAWATALTVMGPDDGLATAEAVGLDALFLVRTDAGFEERTTSSFEALRVR